MLFSGKENIFMCLVAFQKMFRKIFSGVWLCSWKYHRKHIFYLLLTFSHIFSVAKQLYNIIHSSIQKHKQNPEKKIIKSSQIKRRMKRERRLGLTRGKIVRRRRSRDRAAMCCDCDRRGTSWDCGRREGKIAIDGAISPLRLWVVLSLSLSPFARLWAPLFARLSSRSDLKVK